MLRDVWQNGVIIISMSAVYRNLAYAEIVPEPGYAMEIQPPGPWPKDGAVSFEKRFVYMLLFWWTLYLAEVINR